jgi:hypothetical protein
MATKREERKQRSEAQKQNQERQGRQRRWKSRAVVVALAAALCAIGFTVVATRHRDGEESNGRVWSAAHGHWHDKATGLAR